ncbi:hypothetical protein PG991_014786 [Apiospora marii]|uniref:Heterokaryon incompatibility domain-containing protein n=1 Tax=Apiospora marii TaxID=335849 RepID=A0ABR1R595_9PEZI
MEQDATAASEESLILWHQRYLAEDADSICSESDVILEVESDQLDDDEMDKQVKQSMLTTDVAQGFCAKCRYLLGHWPDLPGEWECAVGRLLHTAELTAAALQGCRFCAFIRSILKDRGMFDTLRKLETRLLKIGNEPFEKLTADALTVFLRDIPFQDLPKTFQDAINVTRRLGLEYVWIDALCIIQNQQVGRGEETDWEKEAGKMESVYGGAHVGLAASDASDVHGGFFRKPPHHNGGFSARVSSKGCSRIQCFYESDTYEKSSQDTYLAGRAWALQEKLLAARTISFGRGGMFWECKSTIKSEYLPGGVEYRRGQQHAVRPEDMAWNWSEIVKDYSSATLTVDSDRLPALSGIARRQHGITGDQYLAGMWRKELKTQLPWVCIGRPQKRPNWRAPTWSWASINGPVRYPECWDEDIRPPDSTYISVLDVSTTPAGTDRFGAVAEGSLTLACSAIIHADLENIEGEDKDSGKKAMLLGTDMIPFAVIVDHLDDEVGQRNAGLYLIPVASGRGGRLRTMDDKIIQAQSFHGILLRECSDREHQFSRVGSFWYETDLPQSKEDVSWRERYDDLIRMTEEEKFSAAESRCARILTETENSTARYVITIV